MNLLRITYTPNGPVYKDDKFHTFIMDDFGNAIERKGEIKELAVEFMLSTFIFNAGDIGW